MAKNKKAVRPGEKGKVRLDVRFDDDVHAGLTRLADEAGVSINRIINARGHWAMDAGTVTKVGSTGDPASPYRRIIFSRPDGKREHSFTLDFRDCVKVDCGAYEWIEIEALWA